MADDMSWESAILQVLEGASKPLHYKDEIWAKIKAQKLRRAFGKTPHTTVSVYLSKLVEKGVVLRQDRGLYSLATGDTAEGDDDEDAIRIEAYGLFWRADQMDWSKMKGSLRGQHPDDNFFVDFASQEGVYLLHHHNTPTAVYVGMTSRDEGGLYARLKVHRTDHTSERWETFSWFGFCPVDGRGRLGAPPANIGRRRMIEIVEAILIETILPNLNRQFGKHRVRKYEQQFRR